MPATPAPSFPLPFLSLSLSLCEPPDFDDALSLLFSFQPPNLSWYCRPLSPIAFINSFYAFWCCLHSTSPSFSPNSWEALSALL